MINIFQFSTSGHNLYIYIYIYNIFICNVHSIILHNNNIYKICILYIIFIHVIYCIHIS